MREREAAQNRRSGRISHGSASNLEYIRHLERDWCVPTDADRATNGPYLGVRHNCGPVNLNSRTGPICY